MPATSRCAEGCDEEQAAQRADELQGWDSGGSAPALREGGTLATK